MHCFLMCATVTMTVCVCQSESNDIAGDRLQAISDKMTQTPRTRSREEARHVARRAQPLQP